MTEAERTELKEAVFKMMNDTEPRKRPWRIRSLEANIRFRKAFNGIDIEAANVILEALNEYAITQQGGANGNV
ncbi:MAG: hypothetical protein K2O41_06155 [Clostridia bacterium]|nr:hypothetical protein [Clostridia bacterium]